MGMLKNNVNLNLGELPGEKMEIHELLIGKDGEANLIVIQDISPGDISHVVRLYSLKIENNEHIVNDQIEGFAFPNYEKALEFADRLPEMSAIDLLMFFRQKQVEADADENESLLLH